MQSYDVFKYKIDSYGRVTMTVVGEVKATSCLDAVAVAKKKGFFAPVVAPKLF